MPAEPQFFVWRTSAELAEAVVNGRQAIGLTQVELARRARVGRKFLFQLEHGKPTLRVDKVLAVLQALELVPLVLPVSVIAAM